MSRFKRVLSIMVTMVFVMSILFASSTGRLKISAADGEKPEIPRDIVETKYEVPCTVLALLNIINGYEDGTFKPNNTITRAEFCTIITRMLGIVPAASSAAGGTQFVDVDASHWATAFINTAVERGIVSGYGDGMFGPEDAVTYEQAIKMIISALGYDEQAKTNGGYPTGYMAIAKKLTIIKEDIAAPSADATRGNIALFVFNSLTVPIVDATGATNKTLINDNLKDRADEKVLNLMGITAATSSPTPTAIPSPTAAATPTATPAQSAGPKEITVTGAKRIIKCYPNGVYKALTMSYDDGNVADRKLVEIFNKYSIKGTFNLIPTRFNGSSYIQESEVKALYAGHEVANHSLNHKRLNEISDEEIKTEIESGQKKLEELVGYPVRGFAYPYGQFGTSPENTFNALKNSGHVYARTVNDTLTFDLPSPENFMKLNATVHHNNKNIDLLGMAKEYMALKNKDMSLFYVWGHSYEFNTENNWDLIENFCKTLSNNSAIWFATNIEVCDYLTAQNSLKQTNNGRETIIVNPSKVSVWLVINDKPNEILPGQTLKITSK